MRLTGIIAMAVLLGMIGAGASAQSNNCKPMTVSTNYTRSDNGTGPNEYFVLGGSVTATGAFTITGSGNGPGWPTSGNSQPEGYNAAFMAGTVGDFGFATRQTGISTSQAYTEVGSGIIADETFGNGTHTKYAWYIRQVGLNPYLEFDQDVQGTDGNYTRTIVYQSSYGDPALIDMARVGATFYVYVSYDGVNWTLLTSATDSASSHTTKVGVFAYDETTTGDHLTATYDSTQTGTNGNYFKPVLLEAGLIGNTNNYTGTFLPVFQAGSLTVGPDQLNGYVDVPGGFGYNCSNFPFAVSHYFTLVDNTTNQTILTTATITTNYPTCTTLPSCYFAQQTNVNPYAATIASGHSYTLSGFTQALGGGSELGINSAVYQLPITFSVP